jgi:hypothetical protein
MGWEESAQVDAETNTFGEAPDEVEDARKRFDERVVRRSEQIRSDLEVGAELNAAVAQALGLDASKIPPELVRRIEEVARRESQAEPPPLQEA